MNEVDSWIDMLEAFDTTVKTETQALQNTDISMAWLLQQSLPSMQVPIFDGNPLQWIEFITKYKLIFMIKHILPNNPKFIYLMQHVDGQAKRAFQVISTNKGDYIKALKRIEYMFGQRSRISQTCIAKLTSGKVISNDDDKSLLEFYYTMSDCVVALNQLKYIHDLHSSNVVRQALRRLASKYHNKWAEYCFRLRKNKEPSLCDLETWLQERILAVQEACIRNRERLRKYQGRVGENRWVGKTYFGKLKFILCENKHLSYKCDRYEEMIETERMKLVKKE